METPLEIKKLDESVINRIAAGEVIQRPANALKELIENSLDAKATNIQITVKNGGLKFIQIQDNGSGIRKQDFEIVCERFTTSKLRNFEDLNSIATYGFRGEALASISHVAHLSIQSKTANDKCAYKATFADGKLKGAPKPVAGNQGTQINVEDLFYNMNIRKRALKSGSEEYQKISDVVSKYAIHNAGVGFGLKKFGENNDIRTPPNSTHVDNIRTVYGNLIARELIEFKYNDEAFKFEAHGYMTNVNYSTKKFVLLLFINDRLVVCQSLKKRIDQIFTTYLPKSGHPFVYVSLKLDPINVDVNVHPTKHEVHFLNEEQIIESLTTAMETKLLGSNNSRMFYTQAKLPGVTPEMILAKQKLPSLVVHDKNLVRTDAQEQKLDKFFAFGTPKEKPVNEVTPEIEEQEMKSPSKARSREIKKSESPEEKTKASKPTKTLTFTSSSFSKSRPDLVECNLISVLELRESIEQKCHAPLRELFAQHVFVGCIDSTQALIQHNTKLYLCDTQKIVQELIYQFVLYNFNNFGVIKLSNPVPLHELASIALDLPEAGWTDDDGDKEELAGRICEILLEKRGMLLEYFCLEIDDTGNVLSLPLLMENHIPEMAGLPMYILRLATEVNWEEEKKCFQQFAQETALYYSQLRQENTVESASWKWTVEHVFYHAIKEYFIPPKSFTENAAVLQITDLPNLYKVFERC